jgi:SAM-dependent methyltransferase
LYEYADSFMVYPRSHSFRASSDVLLIYATALASYFLSVFNTRYFTRGLSSFHGIKEKTVDFIWFNAVLEHIKKSEFFDTMCELRRVLRDGGECSHTVDLRDHLNGALNHLRFSESFWESDVIFNSSLYTNRKLCSEILNLMEKSGFEVTFIHAQRWFQLPTSRHAMIPRFKYLADEKLCVYGFDVVLHPK